MEAQSCDKICVNQTREVERERNQVFVQIRDILLLSLAYRYYRHTGCNCQENEQEDFVPVYFYLESESDQFKELQIFRLFSCQISGTGSAGTGI